MRQAKKKGSPAAQLAHLLRYSLAHATSQTRDTRMRQHMHFVTPYPRAERLQSVLQICLPDAHCSWHEGTCNMFFCTTSVAVWPAGSELHTPSLLSVLCWVGIRRIRPFLVSSQVDLMCIATLWMKDDSIHSIWEAEGVSACCVVRRVASEW